MNWQQLFTIQKRLDDRILAERGLARSELVRDKLLALHVELCELANETRCFKYWSQKPPAPRQTILEEYVDVLHFALSLGLDWGYAKAEGQRTSEESVELGEMFLRTIKAVTCLETSGGDKPDEAAYQAMFDSLLTLGRQLGFSEEEIETAYLAKNEINHQRQETGY